MDFLLYSAYCFNKCLTNVTELLIWESSYRILKFWPIPCSSWKENDCQCQRFTRSKKHNKVVKISTSTANSVLSIGFPRENPSCELTRHSGLPRGRCRVSSQDIAPSDSRFPMGLTVVDTLVTRLEPPSWQLDRFWPEKTWRSIDRLSTYSFELQQIWTIDPTCRGTLG